MIKTFTQEDLIRFIYREAPQELHEQITQAICFDNELAEQCANLVHAKLKADKVLRQPSERTISSILEYSKNYKVQS